jgi:hypothetical protein
MAKSVVRNRAKQQGQSVKEQVQDILRDTSRQEATTVRGLGTEISSLFKKAGLEADVPELRGHGIKPAAFD